MGTVATIGDHAGDRAFDASYVQFSKAWRLQVFNDLCENIYNELCTIQSALVYTIGTITTESDTVEYTPSFTDAGIMDDGVWIEGEYGHLTEIAEADKIRFDYDGTSSIGSPDNGDFEDWTGGAPDDWTASASATVAQETSDPYSGTYSLKLTAGAANQYVYSDAFTVAAGENYLLELRYKNTANDVAGYGIYDVTNSAWITAQTDLDDSTVWSYRNQIEFTAPSTCTSVRVYLYAKTNGDVVYFDEIDVTQYVSTGRPVSFYRTEDGDFGFLPIPDDAYLVKVCYYEPLTALSDYDSNTLPFNGIFNRYLGRMLLIEMLIDLERDTTRHTVLAMADWEAAMAKVYHHGVRDRRQSSDLFMTEGI